MSELDFVRFVFSSNGRKGWLYDRTGWIAYTEDSGTRWSWQDARVISGEAHEDATLEDLWMDEDGELGVGVGADSTLIWTANSGQGQ